MATGAIIGGILGGAVAGLATGGTATGLGYALGSGIGGAIEGQALWSKAQKNKIPESDPRLALLFNEIRQKRAGLESGQMYQPQQDMIRQAGAQALGTAAGITGGDIGATVSALGAINRGTGRNLNELYGGMMNQSVNMMQQEQALAQYLAGMRYQSRAYDQQQQMANAAQTLQNGMQNLNAVVAGGGLGSLVGGVNNNYTYNSTLGNNLGATLGKSMSSGLGGTTVNTSDSGFMSKILSAINNQTADNYSDYDFYDNNPRTGLLNLLNKLGMPFNMNSALSRQRRTVNYNFLNNTPQNYLMYQ